MSCCWLWLFCADPLLLENVHVLVNPAFSGQGRHRRKEHGVRYPFSTPLTDCISSGEGEGRSFHGVKSSSLRGRYRAVVPGVLACVHIYMLYVCVYICVCMCVYEHVYMYIYACVYVQVYVCMYVHVYVYVCAYLCIDCKSQ